MDKKLLNVDIRHKRSQITPTLPKSLHDQEELTGPLHLQIVSVKDVSRPAVERLDLASENTVSINGDTPKRILRLRLTDGHSEITAIELNYCSQLKVCNLPPGTKILLKGTMEVVNGLVCIRPQNVKVIGGVVQHLVQKWQATASQMDPFLMSTAGSGSSPPPFVKFDPALHTAVVVVPSRPEPVSIVGKMKIKVNSSKSTSTSTSSKAPPLLSASTRTQFTAPPPVSSLQLKQPQPPCLRCRAINLFLEEDTKNDKTRLMFELENEQTTIQLPASDNLMLVLLGLQAKGAPPLAKLRKSKKGKQYLKNRVERLKKGLLTGSTSLYSLSEPMVTNKSCSNSTTTIVNIA